MVDEHGLRFWIAVMIATVIRVLSAPYESFKASLILVVTSVGCAAIFALPLAALLGATDPNMIGAIGGLVALSSVGLVKWFLTSIDNLPKDPKGIIDLWKQWLGGKK
jgi:uncharacterized membrane protein